jgi:hypothetical protein
MDGSTLDLIVIPLVVVISLAAWLIAVAYAAAHPRWKNDAQAGARSVEPVGTATGGPLRPVADSSDRIWTSREAVCAPAPWPAKQNAA